MPARTETSSIETGSSATSSFGSGMSARANTTRCNCPPDSSCGRRSSHCAEGCSSTRAITASIRLAHAAFGTPKFCNGSDSDRLMVKRGFNASNGFWNTSCACARNRRSGSPRRCVTSAPSNSSLPSLGSSNRSIVRAVVVLPQPDSPTIPSASPSRTASDTSTIARTARGPVP